MTEKPQGLDALFYPRSVAVIGASRHRQTIGAEIFRNLMVNEFQGVIYPVNPKAEFVQAVRCYPSLEEVPGDVDLAIVAVPKKQVLGVVKGCVSKGVKSIVIISAGFREVGEGGIELEREVLELCRKHEIRMVGPNCLGVLNTDPVSKLDATFAPTYPPEGNVAFSSQSGALGHAILEYAKELGIGLSKFVSVGNKADVSGNDLIEYWEHDPKTKVILLYLESFGNPKKFIPIARRVGCQKPIVAVKSGRTAAGARAAASHTGSLSTSDALADALFRQSGVIRVTTVEELFDVAMLLSNQPLPPGRRLAILTNAGGPGILAADACGGHSLELAEFSPQTTARLKELVHPEASVRNPIDLTAHGSPEVYAQAVPLLLKDPNVDALLVIYVPPLVTHPKEVADSIVSAAAGTEKTVLTCFMGKRGVPEGLRSLKKGHIPSYTFPEDAVHALASVVEYVEWKNQPSVPAPKFHNFETKKIEQISKEKGWLSPGDAFSLLEAAGIPVMPYHTAETIDGVASAAKKLGFPVALKIVSEKILHKTELGGVSLNLVSARDVEQAAQKMMDRAMKEGVSSEEISGFLLQKMADPGQELIIGVDRDPEFGSLFMFGLGGTDVEVQRDVAFRLHPLSPGDVRSMVAEIRGFKLLTGFRGRPPLDVEAVEDTLLRLSELIARVPAIAEFDLNPVRLFEKGLVVLDARIRLD